MAPRRNHVDRLDLGGGGQHDVGIAGRVGEELFVHHREQVVAHHPPTDALGVRH
ncbi:MAG: hypothetical protein FD127_2566, partial [Acidimicrobiaceae bacterium]